MRRPRLNAPEKLESAIYHCVSRVVNNQLLLLEPEKEQFVQYMRMYERLFGLEILTYCVMGNHFHLLIEVPKPPDKMPNDSELVELVRKTKGRAEAKELEECLKSGRTAEKKAAAEEARQSYLRQMWSLSQFMKVLKQRFGQWFNGSRPVRRKGTMWGERFRSVIVEPGEATQVMAAYIDLNPVRAGLVDDPKDYAWSGYGEASAGGRLAKRGLEKVMAGGESEASKRGWMEAYRELMMGPPEESKKAARKHPLKPAERRAETMAKIEAKEKLPMHEYLRMRVRYFSDGTALGTRAFVNGLFTDKRQWFSEKRKDGARTLKGLGRGSPLRTMRQLGTPFAAGPVVEE